MVFVVRSIAGTALVFSALPPHYPTHIQKDKPRVHKSLKIVTTYITFIALFLCPKQPTFSPVLIMLISPRATTQPPTTWGSILGLRGPLGRGLLPFTPWWLHQLQRERELPPSWMRFFYGSNVALIVHRLIQGSLLYVLIPSLVAILNMVKLCLLMSE